jgi:hypothetical protein
MNYHSSEDSFLKVENSFLIVVEQVRCHLQGGKIEMVSQDSNPRPKISISKC